MFRLALSMGVQRNAVVGVASCSPYPTRILTACSALRHSHQQHRERGPLETDAEIAKAVEELNAEFSEARDLIKEAMESLGTTYQSDDAKDAIDQTKKTMDLYESIKSRIENRENLDRVMKENDLKFRQLQAELEQVLSHDED